LPDRTDNPEAPSTLPREELNPLINPLLAENMGRWASVYYTSPPEKRQEAILELLRELERERGHSEPRTEVAVDEPTRTHDIDAPPSAPPQPIHCQQCRHENSADQKFCGMCGVPLLASAGTQPPALPSPAFESRVPESQVLESQINESQINRWPLDAGDINWNAQPVPAPVAEAASEPPQQPEAFPQLHSYGQDRSHEYERPLSFLEPQPEEPRSYYRLYIGAALVIIIVALGYVAWRNTQNSSAIAQLAPQTPPAVEQPTKSSPTQPAPPATQPDVNNTAPPKEAAEAPKPARAPSRPEPAPARPNPAALIAKDQPKKSPPPQASAGGSQELAVAEGYLNGTNGRQRNSAEAAQWLWKAVEKRNIAATMLLSDLYLKGNGVPKNCDQAHVLLDAAASRGVRDAAERLRNLKAYGCE
jgi:hypothetical protein